MSIWLKHKQLLKKLFQATFSLVLLVVLFWMVNWKDLIQACESANVILILLGALLFFPSVLESSLRWKLVLDYFKLPISQLRAFNLYLESSFFTNFLPTSFGGDGFKFFVLAREFPNSKKESLSSMVFERGSGFMSLFIVNVLLAIWYLRLLSVNHILLVLECFICATFVAILLFITFRHWAINLLTKYGIDHRYYGQFLRFVRILSDIKQRSVVLGTTFYSILFILNTALGQFFFLRAFGIQNVSFLYLVFVVTIVQIAGILPISLNSIGVSEGLRVFLYGIVGAPPDISLAVSLIGRFSALIASGSGGILYLFESKNENRYL